MTKAELIKAVADKTPLWFYYMEYRGCVIIPTGVLANDESFVGHNYYSINSGGLEMLKPVWNLRAARFISIATPEQLKLCGVPERKEV